MKVQIITSQKNVEMANYILARSINRLKGNRSALFALGIDETDLQKADIFRKSLVKGFIKNVKNNIINEK